LNLLEINDYVAILIFKDELFYFEKQNKPDIKMNSFQIAISESKLMVTIKNNCNCDAKKIIDEFELPLRFKKKKCKGLIEQFIF
jgi:hypothetical protein